MSTPRPHYKDLLHRPYKAPSPPCCRVRVKDLPPSNPLEVERRELVRKKWQRESDAMEVMIKAWEKTKAKAKLKKK